ncbi:hypothetical protein LC612_30160 [Nostoc sp. CHAB 5834]|nr:hypothetical protein [Nostoc sp. CHAB 5834]
MEQHISLDTLGILRQVKVPAELAWMSDEEKSFLLELLFAGEEGIHKRIVTKFSKKSPDAIFNLTVRNMAEWISDKAGRPTFLTVTWKGEDAAKLLFQIAKNDNRKKPWTPPTADAKQPKDDSK